MKHILIDAGNSCLKLSIIKKNTKRVTQWDCLSYDNLYECLFNKLHLESVSGIFVCNVNKSDVLDIISALSYNLWELQPHILTVEQNKYELSTCYKDYKSLGSDRWAAMISARQQFKTNFCIIDCGTAITVDVVTKEGIHLGGLISPGLAVCRQALGMAASNLPVAKQLPTRQTVDLLATNTLDGILWGTYHQMNAYVEYMVNKIYDDFDESLEVVITGGGATVLPKHLLQMHHYQPALVLDGLRIVAQKVFKKETL